MPKDITDLKKMSRSDLFKLLQGKKSEFQRSIFLKKGNSQEHREIKKLISHIMGLLGKCN